MVMDRSLLSVKEEAEGEEDTQVNPGQLSHEGTQSSGLHGELARHL